MELKDKRQGCSKSKIRRWSGTRGGSGGVRQGEVEDQEVGPIKAAPRG
jgi:hypothetical protein